MWVGSVFVFGAMGAAGRLRPRQLLLGLVVFTGVFLTYPLAVRLAGASGTGQNFLLWQLLRRANHPFWFYFSTLPGAVGVAVLVLALLGLVLRRRLLGWRERLLLAWIAVPVAFFTLWPVKGYQYLLPIAPALAVLAALPVAALWHARKRLGIRPGSAAPGRARRGAALCAGPALALVAMATLLVPTWRQTDPSDSTAFLAGTGGLPGGREAGRWIAAHLPHGAELLGSGPSIANVLEYYSGREVGAVGVQRSAGPQSGVPAGPQPGPRRTPGRVPVPRLGLLHRGAHAVFRLRTGEAREQVPRDGRLHRDGHGGHQGRPGPGPGHHHLRGASVNRLPPARPRRPGWCRRAALTVCAALLPVVGPTGLLPRADAQPVTTTTPIKHFIYLMQGPRSFDNYFGTYPGAEGFPAHACQSAGKGRPCVAPHPLHGLPTAGLPGTDAGLVSAEVDGGRMDGFVSAYTDQGRPGADAMGYYNATDLPTDWAAADRYVLFDQFYSDAQYGTVANRSYWVAAAAPDGDRLPSGGYGNLQTIFDRLDAAGISWKFYVQNYTTKNTSAGPATDDQAARVPLLDYPASWTTPRCAVTSRTSASTTRPSPTAGCRPWPMWPARDRTNAPRTRSRPDSG
ncbi:hypothetical protein GXW82_09570 [Streptacidiphilus sp. 4-A2]|nr:hypothetical protein [Streptacidiphilus sp. 4-A2]